MVPGCLKAVLSGLPALYKCMYIHGLLVNDPQCYLDGSRYRTRQRCILKIQYGPAVATLVEQDAPERMH